VATGKPNIHAVLVERHGRLVAELYRTGPDRPDETYIAHEFPERLVDLGEVEMNYATLGDESSPALLLIPGQTESWWGYEAAMPRLAEHFEVFAVDLPWSSTAPSLVTPTSSSSSRTREPRSR
jgi:hypothetical protein